MLVYILALALAKGADKILLSDLKVLALSEGKYTNGRRSSPVPQLTCRGQCSDWKPSSVLCKNMGTDGHDAQWECTSDMPEGYRFGTIDVSCEGYNYPDDAYVLVGSCGLTYELKGPSGRRHATYDSPYREAGSYSSSDATHSLRSFGFGTVLVWVVLGFIAYLVYKACTKRGGPGFFGGGSWGGNPGYPGGGARGAPPPYSDSCNPPPAQQRPGFWSGMMGGGALGYMLGSRNNNAGNAQRFGGGQQQRAGGFSTSSSRSPSHSSGGGARTAYGGTSRR